MINIIGERQTKGPGTTEDRERSVGVCFCIQTQIRVVREDQQEERGGRKRHFRDRATDPLHRRIEERNAENNSHVLRLEI